MIIGRIWGGALAGTLAGSRSVDGDGVGFESIAPTVVAALGADVVTAEVVPGSVANQDFLVELTDGRRVFVKVAPRPELVAEVWALERAAAAGVPVPRGLSFDGDPGTPQPSLLILELLPTDGKLPANALRTAGRALKVVHGIELSGYGGIDVAGDPYAPDRIGGRYPSWRDYVASILADIDELVDLDLLSRARADRVRRWAETSEASPLLGDEGALLHSDLKPQHILSVDGRLTGIIDWGDASVGDPAWDLARASMMDPHDFRALADGYPGADDPGVRRLLPFYRVLWNAKALIYEFRAGGDWFAAYQQRISADLDLL